MIIYIAGNGGAKGPVGKAIEEMIYNKSGRRLFSYHWIRKDLEGNFNHNFQFWRRRIRSKRERILHQKEGR